MADAFLKNYFVLGYSAYAEFEYAPLKLQRVRSTHSSVSEAKEWVEEQQEERPETFRCGAVIVGGMPPTVIASFMDGEWV